LKSQTNLDHLNFKEFFTKNH